MSENFPSTDALPPEGKIAPPFDDPERALMLPPTESHSCSRSDQATKAVTAPVSSIPGYEILAEVGRGGMGVVYKALQIDLDRLVALKMILAGSQASAADLARFRTEALAVARLRHGNIIQIHDVGEHKGTPFLSLEYCGGASLAQRINGTPLPPREAARIVEVLARAIEAAHQRGIIHRDRKPANVLFLDDGTPKITDFGLARKLDDAGQTVSGAVVGTPSYMPPEQACGKVKEAGPQADVYALGAILYEMVTGRPPFKGPTPAETLHQVLFADPVPPRQLQPGIPKDLETICLKCLQKEAHKRFASAAELADDLQRFQSGLPIRARPVGHAERTWRWCRRNPGLAILALGFVVSLLAGSAVSIFFAIQSHGHAKTADENAERAGREAKSAGEEKFKAQQEAENAYRRSYISDIRLVQRAWDDLNFERMNELLAGLRPEHTGGLDLRRFEWHYWQRLSQGHGLTIPAGGLPVVFSPDGSRVARAIGNSRAAFGFKVVGIWDLASGKQLLSRNLEKEISAIALAHDNKRVACAHSNEISIVDATSGKDICSLKTNSDCRALVFSPDGKLLVAALDGAAKIWDAETGKEMLSINEPRIECLAFSPDSKLLASNGQGETIKVWEAGTGKDKMTLRGHTHLVCSVIFSPKGDRLASASRDKTIRVWDSKTGKMLRTIGEMDERNYQVTFSPDGSLLASYRTELSKTTPLSPFSQAELVRVWDAETASEVFSMPARNRGVLASLAFTDGGKNIAVASIDDVKVLTPQDREALSLAGADGFAFGPRPDQVVTRHHDSVSVWSVQTGQEQSKIQLKDPWSYKAWSFCAGGKRLALASDKEIEVVDTRTFRQLFSRKEDNGAVKSLTVSKDGRRLGVLYHGGPKGPYLLKVWDTDTGENCFTLKDESNVPDRFFVSPRGNFLVAGWKSERPPDRNALLPTDFVIWSLKTREKVFSLKCADAWPKFSLDDKKLAAVRLSPDAGVKVWDTETWRETFALKRHYALADLDFAPPRNELLVINSSTWPGLDQWSLTTKGTMEIWDLRNGKQICSLKGHTGHIGAHAITPDGERIVTSSIDKTLRMWDIRTGQELFTFTLNDAAAEMEFSPDGHHLRARTPQGNRLLIWNGKPAPKNP
jgi:WD40 repeat protein